VLNLPKNTKKIKQDTDKKGKKAKKNNGDMPSEVIASQPHFAPKRKKQEIDWLIFPIIIVILLIILFVVKIAIALIEFSQEETTGDAISVNISGQPIPTDHFNSNFIPIYDENEFYIQL
jgi:flagellar basal body-associated protein FliL